MVIESHRREQQTDAKNGEREEDPHGISHQYRLPREAAGAGSQSAPADHPRWKSALVRHQPRNRQARQISGARSNLTRQGKQATTQFSGQHDLESPRLVYASRTYGRATGEQRTRNSG
jgi:hypothetical protein